MWEISNFILRQPDSDFNFDVFWYCRQAHKEDLAYQEELEDQLSVDQRSLQPVQAAVQEELVMVL